MCLFENDLCVLKCSVGMVENPDRTCTAKCLNSFYNDNEKCVEVCPS